MNDETALDEAMTRLADGDRSAFDDVYRALHPRAVALARRRLRDDSLAHDAAQETMTKMFSRATEFRAGAHVVPWFYAICANEIRALERKRGAVSMTDENEDHAMSEDANAEEAIQARELSRALEYAVASLDRDSADAIAAMLGERARPIEASATFRKRVSRAYAKLRVLVGGFHVF